MTFTFNGSRPLGEDFRRLALGELRAAVRTAARPEKGPAKAIHSARTGCKKVRALLRLVEPAFPARRRENAALRDAAAGLAAARDASVMAATLRRLQKSSTPPVQAAIERTLALIEATAPADGGEAALARFHEAAKPIGKRARRWRLTTDSLGVVIEGAARAYRSTRKAMERAVESGADEDFHEWRKRAKTHWYHLDLLRGLDASACDSLKAAERLGELLGKHHDLAVLHTFLTTPALAAPKDRRRIITAIESTQQKLAKRCFEAGEKLFAAAPSKWRATLARDLRKHAPPAAVLANA